MIDLFGNEIIKDVLLRDTFKEPPFSVLDTKQKSFIDRRKLWIARGIKSEIGRSDSLTYASNAASIDYYRVKEGKKETSVTQGTSIFNPAVCEVIYHWFCPENGKILDPFAGGSVRGIVANYLGYKYTGIDISEIQIKSNVLQSIEILHDANQPNYLIGNSNKILDNISESFDFVFSCPPYGNLEKYSDLEEDISNMNYEDFLIVYRSIINKCCKILKHNSYACFVVGEFRNKDGDLVGFIPDTIAAFKDAGMKFYNEAILLTNIASGSMRAANNMKSQKLVKVHQNILIFKKP